MYKSLTASWLLPIAALLLLFSIPRSLADKMQEGMVSLIYPVTSWLYRLKFGALSSDVREKEEIEKARGEIARLRGELDMLRSLAPDHLAAQGAFGRVIFRSPASWSSTLWIDIGKDYNAAVGYEAIAYNSPVMANGALIGVIDYVANKQSRVRLITDMSLTPSVRAVRGKPLNDFLRHAVAVLCRQLQQRPELAAGDSSVGPALHALYQHLGKYEPALLMAKGELRGSSLALGYRHAEKLKGVGFNCDFVDDETMARDLRTGMPQGQAYGKAVPLLQVGDLLVTSGFDGVFPPGLPVAEVVFVHPLGEGDYEYHLEAMPVAGDLKAITGVVVLPPRGFDDDVYPPAYWQQVIEA